MKMPKQKKMGRSGMLCLQLTRLEGRAELYQRVGDRFYGSNRSEIVGNVQIDKNNRLVWEYYSSDPL